MAEEALICFQDLLSSVPVWIADLENILEKATQRQKELLVVNQPAIASQRTLVRKTSKSSSLNSKHSDGEEEVIFVEEEAQEETLAPTLLRPQLPHMSNSDALRLSQRKRKTASACSGDKSGPCKYRSRSMVVVYYDGDAQKQFEALVRAVGTSRNHVRKGKMSLRIDSLARSESESSGSDSSGSGGEETIKGLGTFTYKTTRTRRVDRSMFGKDGGEAFEKIDKLLETTQAMCERAAHQILRDGDCAAEVNNSKKQLADVRSVAEQELPILKRKAAKSAERRRRSEEQRRVEQEEQQSQNAATHFGNEKAGVLGILPHDGPLEVDNVEADDDDGDSSEGEMDLGAMKLPSHLNRYTTRSSQLGVR